MRLRAHFHTLNPAYLSGHTTASEASEAGDLHAHPYECRCLLRTESALEGELRHFHRLPVGGSTSGVSEREDS